MIRFVSGLRILTLGISLVIPLSSKAFDAPSFFEKQCGSCHTVGFGDDIGPDLKGVTERRSEAWLILFIQSSQDVIRSGDTVATDLFNKYKRKKMPDHNLTRGEIQEILKFISAGGSGQKPLDLKSATKALKGEIDFGRRLFLGEQLLSAGGPACLSCHSIGNYVPLGGGTLGPNLSRVYSKYEDGGLTKALAKTGFPVMREVYADTKLSADEVYALKAFLYTEDQQEIVSEDFQKKFLFLSVGGLVIAMGVIDFIWRRRRQKTVKPRQGGER